MSCVHPKVRCCVHGDLNAVSFLTTPGMVHVAETCMSSSSFTIQGISKIQSHRGNVFHSNLIQDRRSRCDRFRYSQRHYGNKGQEYNICNGGRSYMKNEHVPEFLSGPMQLTFVSRLGPILSMKMG